MTSELKVNGLLSKHFNTIHALFPILEESYLKIKGAKKSSCTGCLKMKVKVLTKMLQDMFLKIGIIYDKKVIKEDPASCFKQFKTLIVHDSSLTSDQKVKILKS